MIPGQGLLAEHVEHRAGQAAAFERGEEIRLDDQIAAADVDQPGARLHCGQSPGVEQAARGGGRGQHRDRVVAVTEHWRERRRAVPAIHAGDVFRAEAPRQHPEI